MPPGSPVPADFVAFVSAHEGRLRAACEELTGQAQLGDLLAVDLLATVALRWRLRPPPRRHRAGAARLDRLLRREARAWRRPVEPVKRPGRIRVLLDAPVTTTGFADRAWNRARIMRRATALAGLGLVVLLTVIVLVGPRPPEVPLPPDPVPVPSGVFVLPPFGQLTGLLKRTTALPSTMDATAAAAVDLTGRPARRASAVLRQATGPLIVLVEDGAARKVDSARLAGGQLVATSLSPDGERVALLAADGLRVIDISSGAVRPVAVPTSGSALVWRSPRTVVLPSGVDSVEVNVDTGATTTLAGVRGVDLLSARGPADLRLVELLPASVSLPPRIRQFNGTAFDDRPIFGPPWVSTWTGPGWSTLDLLVRPCTSVDLVIPQGPAGAALAAVTATGLYQATLVAADSTALDVIGFADTGTVLVGAYSPAATAILAWSPQGRSVQLVTTVNGNARLSIADLLPAGS